MCGSHCIPIGQHCVQDVCSMNDDVDKSKGERKWHLRQGEAWKRRQGEGGGSPQLVQDVGAGLRSEYNQVRTWSGVQEPGDRRHGKWAGL